LLPFHHSYNGAAQSLQYFGFVTLPLEMVIVGRSKTKRIIFWLLDATHTSEQCEDAHTAYSPGDT
jgi:hypothetical protein